MASMSEPRSSSGVSNIVRTLVDEVLDWQKRNGVQRIPSKYAGGSIQRFEIEEHKLGMRCAKVLLRREKSLGTAPSELQLSPFEVALVNSMPGVPLRGCSATASCNSNVDQHQPELPIILDGNDSSGIHHTDDTTNYLEHHKDGLERQQKHIETLQLLLTDTKPSDPRIMELAQRLKVTELGVGQQEFHNEVWAPQMLTTHAGQPAAPKPNEPSLNEPRSSSGVSHQVRTLVADVADWQKRNGVQTIPNQHARPLVYDGNEERKLGSRCAKVLLRRDKSLGTTPSEVQLSPFEVALVNSMPGVPLHGCSTTASCNSNVAQQSPERTTTQNVHGTHGANKKACVGSAGTGSGASHHDSPSNRIEEFERPSNDFDAAKKRPRHRGSILPTGSSDTHQELRPTMIFLKILEPIWAIEVADGQKMFECVANKARWQNQFKQLTSGDIMIICIKGQNKVSAVCEVASTARTQETNREVLKSKLQESRHEALEAYLDDAESFDYVEFKQVFDCRSVFSEFDIAASLARVGLARPPRTPLLGLVRPDVIDTQWHNRLYECMQQATPRMPVSLGT